MGSLLLSLDILGTKRKPIHLDWIRLSLINLVCIWSVQQLSTLFCLIEPGFDQCNLESLNVTYNPFPKPIENDELDSEQPHRFGLAFSPSTQTVSKIKNLKRSNFGQSVFFRAQNALCCKSGGAIIGLQVSKQDGVVFSSSPTCLSFVRVNPPIPTQFRCRNQKIWGKRISSLKSTWMWKSQIMDCVCWIMISNQPTDVMWQNRHILPQQNHALMKKNVEKMSRVGLALVARHR